MEGGAGDDLLVAGFGRFLGPEEEAPSVTLRGGAGDDMLEAGGGADLLEGGGGADTISAGGGADSVDAGDGDDRIVGGPGGGLFDGGAGTDRVVFAIYGWEAEGLAISLRDPGLASGPIAGTVLRDVEAVDAGFGDDRVIGDDAANDLGGRGGEDLIVGLAGADVLAGDRGEDTVVGGAGADSVIGGQGDDLVRGGRGRDSLQGWRDDDVLSAGRGDDLLRGGAGDDTLRGGGGADEMRGGGGFDTADYTLAIGGIALSLADPALNDGRAAGDALVSVERVLGSLFDDALEGNAFGNVLAGMHGDDVLSGGEGADRLFGGIGSDVLVGGLGDDVLRGGGGADLFVFGPDGGADAIADFRAGSDLIGLSGELFAGEATAEEVIEAHLQDTAEGLALVFDDDRLLLRGISDPAAVEAALVLL
jgi:Ca2+-binding RTX toxin-like protein